MVSVRTTNSWTRTLSLHTQSLGCQLNYDLLIQHTETKEYSVTTILAVYSIFPLQRHVADRVSVVKSSRPSDLCLGGHREGTT